MILQAREDRRKKIDAYSRDYEIIVSLKVNTPGSNKNLPESQRLLFFLDNEVKSTLPFHKRIAYDSLDGNYILYLINQANIKTIKELMIHLEETHPLGRFVDIDVYGINGAFSRRDLGIPSRKCLICGDVAFVCMRDSKHTLDELLTTIQDALMDYIKERVEKRLVESFIKELNLHPKFGLVTKHSQGSHKDMDYEMMVRSIYIIIPYLMQMYVEGYETKDVDKGFSNIRQIGLEAEKAMLLDSGGVNTYKGAIFLIGIFVYALGYYHQTLESNIIDIVKYISRNILVELSKDPDTFGIEAYQKHNVYTIRHEVYYGLPSVIKAESYLSKLESIDDRSLTLTLINIISNKNDTVGLKRSQDFVSYYAITDEIEHIKTYDIKKIEAVTQKCIDLNISFGGSADVLIATLLLHLLKQDKLV